MVRVHFECGCCRKYMGFCNGAILVGDGLSTVRVSSSSEELNVNRCHTGLQCDWLVPVLCGFTGTKEMLSSLETWWILDVLLRRRGYAKIFSLPLLYPSSSNLSLLSNAALSVSHKVTKQNCI